MMRHGIERFLPGVLHPAESASICPHGHVCHRLRQRRDTTIVFAEIRIVRCCPAHLVCGSKRVSSPRLRSDMVHVKDRCDPFMRATQALVETLFDRSAGHLVELVSHALPRVGQRILGLVEDPPPPCCRARHAMRALWLTTQARIVVRHNARGAKSGDGRRARAAAACPHLG